MKLKQKKKSEEIIDTIVTHPEKVFWPEQGYTKIDLLDYYYQVSETILPYLKDRPMVLHRYPDGIEGESFYQKTAPSFLPKWINTVEIQHSNKVVNYILVDSVESLLYVANSGSIEMHSFMTTYNDLDHPDFLALDLDPEGLSFSAVIEVAQEIHKYLKRKSVQHFCKTSGKRGLHIFLPVQALYDYEQVEEFAKLIAFLMQENMPKLINLERLPKNRQKKVYIDFLQNNRTKTMVAPYSVRPVNGATVSTPLDWSEVKEGLNPADFTIKTVPERLKKKGDPFHDILSAKSVDLSLFLK